MEHKSLWETPTPTIIKELALKANLNPYYLEQETAIKKFAELLVNECRDAVLISDSVNETLRKLETLLDA